MGLYQNILQIGVTWQVDLVYPRDDNRIIVTMDLFQVNLIQKKRFLSIIPHN